MSEGQVEIVPAAITDKPVVRQLLELYHYDFTEFVPGDVDEHGLFGYRYLDHYWTESDRCPLLFRVNGNWAGFALVRTGSPHDMAEFFVMRRYRRSGIGIQAARAVFARFPGAWQVRQMASNPASTVFWKRAIPVPFEDGTHETGPMQTFVMK
jgi:predicted acetyltransferase